MSGGIIYKYTNKINGKVYIGQTKSEVPRKHDKGTSLLRLAIDKYGMQSFEAEVIDYASTREVLTEKELYWIIFYDCIAPKGYNISGMGRVSSGHPPWNKGLTKETNDIVAKYAERLKGKHGYPSWNKGLKKHTDVRVKGTPGKRGPNPKHAAAMKGKTPWNKGLRKERDLRLIRCGWNKGLTKNSDPRVAAMAESNKGKHGGV